MTRLVVLLLAALGAYTLYKFYFVLAATGIAMVF
jgi:hypothetical protein